MKNDDIITLDETEEEIFCPKCGTEFGLKEMIRRKRREAEDNKPWRCLGEEEKIGRRWCPKCRFRLIVWVVWYRISVP